MVRPPAAIAALLICNPGALAFHLPSLPSTMAPSNDATRRVLRAYSSLSDDVAANYDGGAPLPPPAAAPLQSVNRDKLLSALIHAAHYGSKTIASLSTEARSGAIQFKEEGDARSALTLADTSAQRVIVSSILGKYPQLNIVGEEDETVQADPEFSEDLREDLLEGYDWTAPLSGKSNGEEPPEELDLTKVVVYVDPLDGTREFVEGRLDNVQSLVGVCYKGVPIMGAVGLPFPDNKGGNATEVVFGIVGKGIGKVGSKVDSDAIVDCAVPELRQYAEGDAICISSGDSKSVMPAIDLAESTFAPEGGITRQIVGATGNKLLRVVHGDTTLSIMHDKTSLWDSAAPTALLHAMGGKVTDYYGEPLVYNKKQLGNKLGVVASASGARHVHDRMTQAMRSDKVTLSFLEMYGLNRECEHSSEGHCVDIARDLEGYPLSTEYFASKLGVADASSYSCPEEGAVRGLMSNACRVRLHPSGDTAFYKRIVFEHLEHAQVKKRTAPHKLVRDVKSYKVESSFLASKACKQVIETAGLRIPKCYDAELQPNDAEPIESKFSVLLEDFAPTDGWTQRWLLRDEEETKATLTVLAKMHAFFWNGSSFWKDSEAAKELEEGVWESAGYVQPNLQTLNQCKDVAAGWATRKLMCQKELESTKFYDNLGERLESVAEEAGRLAHPFADNELAASYRKYRTFTHGDPKQANLFFRYSSDDSEVEVGLIDFQWAGFGLAATDIAHFLSAAVHADLLIDGGEARLLRHYHDELQKHLIAYGAFSSLDEAAKGFEFDTFIDQYETAVLDMCRLVIAYAWSRFEPVDPEDEEGCARTANKNSYNKSTPNVVFLMSRCDEILKSRGV
ncbi:hypothetical protein ACHAXT_012473 [Thalassiosira profunda]